MSGNHLTSGRREKNEYRTCASTALRTESENYLNSLRLMRHKKLTKSATHSANGSYVSKKPHNRHRAVARAGGVGNDAECEVCLRLGPNFVFVVPEGA